VPQYLVVVGLLNRISRWFERRATLRDSEGWLYDWVTGGKASATGLAVSPSTALTLSGYFAGVRAIAEDLGKIPLILLRRRSDGGKDRALSHPLYRILRLRPNPNMSAMDWRSAMVAFAISWGNGYSEIVRAPGSGQVVELWPLDSSRMRIIYHEDDGRLLYIYRDPVTNRERKFEQYEIFHLRGLSSDGIQGYSLARLARESIALGLAQERSGAAFFGNASRPSGVLEADHWMKKEQRIEVAREWQDHYAGVDKAHKTAVLSGMTFKPVTIPNEDAQWIEARHLTIEEMARWLRVPPHKIAHLLRATFDNIEHQSIEYVTDCLYSWAVKIEQEISRKLISLREQNNLFAEHLFDALLRTDIKTRFEAYGSGRQWGHLTINEIRLLENRNPIGPAGDVHMVPANMMNAERLLRTEEPSHGIGDTEGNQGDRPPDTESALEGDAQEKGARGMAVLAGHNRIFAGAEQRSTAEVGGNGRAGNDDKAGGERYPSSDHDRR
jgi:HK97 family phage portal protein